MFTRDKDKLAWSKFLILLSVLSASLAVLGAMGSDFYLASTQWMLVGILSGGWAVYCLVESQFRLKK